MDVLSNKDVLDVYNNQMRGTQNDKATAAYTVLNKRCQQNNVSWDFNEKRSNRIAKIMSVINKRQSMRKSSVEAIDKWESGDFVKLIPVNPPTTATYLYILNRHLDVDVLPSDSVMIHAREQAGKSWTISLATFHVMLRNKIYQLVLCYVHWQIKIHKTTMIQ